MVDSTANAVIKGFGAERPKSAVITTPSTRRPRCTPTSTLSAPPFIAQPTISFRSAPATRGAGSRTPRSSCSASPRRSWASRATAASSPWPESASATSSPSCRLNRAFTSAAAGSRTRSSGSSGSSPRRAPAQRTPSSCSTRPRSSAGARARPQGAPRWEMRRLRLLSLALALLLGHAPAPGLRARRDTASGHPGRRRPPRARGRARSARANAQRWGGRGLRQGLRRARVRPLGRGDGRSGPAPSPPRRARGRAAPVVHPPADRVGFWTCKDVLTLERHGARTLANLRVRVATRLLCLAACISLNHQLGRPSRSLVAYVAVEGVESII